ncbi:MAG TPA: leucine--tRNA ligase [Polyangiaceae bacterium]|nr:leucine--tRNA ligase [Polyangiaceae bacterium]
MIEPRWQKYWDDHQTFRSERHPGRPKAYILDMFPYPSGSGLHVGHPLGYLATDIIARKRRMEGFDVLHPMGWDAFGLPAEQHAIKTGQHPQKTTAENVAVYRRQLKRLGFAYDWSREIDTTDPSYVRCTQWIFLKLFERGLAFQAEIPVNWCPGLGTVLANEEVIDGRSEVGGFPVVRQPLRQWQLRITAYADRLSDELDLVDWPETKQKQRDWIGKSEGAEVEFPIVGRSDKLTVFTTRPDTLFGATYMVIAPDHPLTLQITTAAQRAEVEAYVAAAARKSDMERTALNRQKTGVLTGASAKNPLNGREIPIFTADYVLGAYGTGAIMAVPAHDERDFEFAREKGLPIVEVVSPDGTPHETLDAPFTADGIAVRSGDFTGQATAEMKRNIIRFLEQEKLGRSRVNYKLRDWVFSRQRYWGEPIPIYFPVKTSGDPRQGAEYTIDYQTPIPVPESELPVALPELEDYRPGDPQGPLARATDWRFFQKDGKWFARETNTMPQWAGSCWYYLRYTDPKNPSALCSSEAYDAWMPVDLYVGGSEHAVLHLLYARFWHKVLFDLGVVKHPEPFIKLVHQGTILGTLFRYYRGASGALYAGDDPRVRSDGAEHSLENGEKLAEAWATEAEIEWRDGAPYLREQAVKVVAVSEKMSKSRGNVVNPDGVIDEHGTDALRVYEMFMGPLEQMKPWQTSGIHGVRRFLDRLEVLTTKELDASPMAPAVAKLVHQTVKKVTEDIDALRLNTAVSAMMILVNELTGLPKPPREGVEKLVLCVAPFAPHLAEELWERLGHPPSVANAPWPSFEPALCVETSVEIGVQVSGKVRGRVTLAVDAPEADAKAAGLADPNVAKFLEGKQLVKVVYVPGKILNFIAR